MADRPEYTEIEHTADVGIALSAPDIRSAFESTAGAAFDMMCDLDRVASDESFEFRVEGRPGDLEHLMVRWLSELLYLYSSKGVLLSEFEILELRGGVLNAGEARRSRTGEARRPHTDDGEVACSSLTARVRGERFDARRHPMKIELKAPTYHQLAVEHTDDGWSVRIIFDT